MLVPLSWLREHADLPADATGRDVAERLIRAGLEVEARRGRRRGRRRADRGRAGRRDRRVHREQRQDDPVLPGRRRQPTLAPPDQPTRGIICGARNFVVGDHVVVALPGAVLPGGFAITARKTYGHVSDGMICSTRELGIGDDHAGILVLGSGWTPGHDLEPDLGLRDEVLDVAITPDRGYCMSVRGLARELATAYGVAFHDPADREVDLPGGGHRRTRSTRPGATGSSRSRSPASTRPRDRRCGCARGCTAAASGRSRWPSTSRTTCRSSSASRCTRTTRRRLAGGIVVREATAGETVETLDDAERALEAHDVVITDAGGSRLIGVAGVMGGANTEIGPAHDGGRARGGALRPGRGVAHRPAAGPDQRGREAVRAWGRPDDPGGRGVARRRSSWWSSAEPGDRRHRRRAAGAVRRPVRMAADHPDRVAGMPVRRGSGDATARPTSAARSAGSRRTAELEVQPPPWRPDLLQPNDLAEEVIRLEGYENLPSVLPLAPAGRGLTERQRMRRRVGRALAAAGYVEVLPSPFIGNEVLDGLGIDTDDERRRLVRVANPLSDEEPYLRPLLLADLLPTLRRNVGRGTPGCRAVRARQGVHRATGRRGRRRNGVPRPSVEHRPSDDELARLDATLPLQPEHVAVVWPAHGSQAAGGGAGRTASWADAVEAARVVADAAGVEIRSARRSKRRGTPAAARRSSSTASWSGGPASCIRGSPRRWTSQPGRLRWSSTSSCSRGPAEPR